jgi:hypothetical protein
MGSCTSKDKDATCMHERLMYAVAVMIGREAQKYCKQNLVQYVLRPMIRRHLGRPYIRLGSLVVVAACNLDAGRPQLFRHMREVASAAPWLEEVYGVIVADDARAEYYVLRKEGGLELKAEGDSGEVIATAITALCSGKVSIVAPEDIATIFGI